MEADRRADMESTVILSKLWIYEVKAGGKGERGWLVKYWRKPF